MADSDTKTAPAAENAAGAAFAAVLLQAGSAQPGKARLAGADRAGRLRLRPLGARDSGGGVGDAGGDALLSHRLHRRRQGTGDHHRPAPEREPVRRCRRQMDRTALRSGLCPPLSFRSRRRDDDDRSSDTVRRPGERARRRSTAGAVPRGRRQDRSILQRDRGSGRDETGADLLQPIPGRLQRDPRHD